MDWNQWLGDIGAQDREPSKHAVDMDVSSDGSGYRVVHNEDPPDEDGFESTPVITDNE